MPRQQKTDQRNSHRNRQLLDVPAAADYLCTSERHIRRLVDERRIGFIKLGGGRSAPLRFDTTHLDAWLDAHTFEPEGLSQPQPAEQGGR